MYLVHPHPLLRKFFYNFLASCIPVCFTLPSTPGNTLFITPFFTPLSSYINTVNFLPTFLLSPTSLLTSHSSLLPTSFSSLLFHPFRGRGFFSFLLSYFLTSYTLSSLLSPLSSLLTPRLYPPPTNLRITFYLHWKIIGGFLGFGWPSGGLGPNQGPTNPQPRPNQTPISSGRFQEINRTNLVTKCSLICVPCLEFFPFLTSYFFLFFFTPSGLGGSSLHSSSLTSI